MMYFQSEIELSNFLSRRKIVACPHCKQFGFLILHGSLFGYCDQSSIQIVRRAKRIFCNNRKRRNGCGRTISVYLTTIIKNYTIRSKTLSEALLNILSGEPIYKAFNLTHYSLTISNAYHIIRKIKLRQEYYRTILFKRSEPPLNIPNCSTLVQTIYHLKELFSNEKCIVAGFQTEFNTSFI